MMTLIQGSPSIAREDSDRSAALQGNPAQFFGPHEYPSEALRKQEQGRVVARLTIDRTGRVTDCKVEQSSGSTALDVKTCVIAVGRVTFMPAREANGRSIPSSYTLPVRWVLPESRPEPRQSTNELFTLTVAPDDRIERCTLTRNGKTVAEANAFCTELRGDGGDVQIRRFRAAAGPGRLVFNIQRVVQFPGAAAVGEVHSMIGHVVVAVRRAAVDILPDGTAANQQIVEQTGPGSAPDPIGTLSRYQPAESTQQVQILIATSYLSQR